MWILISVCLAMAVSVSDSVYVPCNTNYTLVPETHVAIQNVGYPSNFQTPYNCFWTFTGPAAGYFKQIICTNYTMGAPCDLNFIKVNGGKICPLPANTSIKTKKEALEINIQGATAPGRFNCTLDLPVDPCSCSRIVKVKLSNQYMYTSDAPLVNSTGTQICLSTLLTVRDSVTTTTCVLPYTASQIKLMVGYETPSTAVYVIVGIIKHPNYVAATRKNDLAIVTTQTSILFGENVGVACLLMAWTIPQNITLQDASNEVRFKRQPTTEAPSTAAPTTAVPTTAGPTTTTPAPTSTCGGDFLCALFAQYSNCAYMPGTSYPFYAGGNVTFMVGMVNCYAGSPVTNMTSLYDNSTLNWIRDTIHIGTSLCAENCIGPAPCRSQIVTL